VGIRSLRGTREYPSGFGTIKRNLLNSVAMSTIQTASNVTEPPARLRLQNRKIILLAQTAYTCRYSANSLPALLSRLERVPKGSHGKLRCRFSDCANDSDEFSGTVAGALSAIGEINPTLVKAIQHLHSRSRIFHTLRKK
jgi:hypothetical protein